MLVAWLVAAPPCAGHPADISHLRVRVEHDRIEFRFTLNLASMSRIVAVDGNGDEQITFGEIAAAAPAMRDFLAKGTLVKINNTPASLGDFTGHSCFWPNAQTTIVTPPDQAQRFVDFNFVKPWSQGVEDVWIGFKLFEHLGDLHVIQCIYQQPGEHDTPVEFSSYEPDYLYDTGWSAIATVTAPPVLKPTAVARTVPMSWIAALGAVVVSLIAFLRRGGNQ